VITVCTYSKVLKLAVSTGQLDAYAVTLCSELLGVNTFIPRDVQNHYVATGRSIIVVIGHVPVQHRCIVSVQLCLSVTAVVIKGWFCITADESVSLSVIHY